MSSEERRKILEMVEQGKISAEQAAHLEFVATLGDKPIWNEFFGSAS